jgi:hypothetical protein
MDTTASHSSGVFRIPIKFVLSIIIVAALVFSISTFAPSVMTNGVAATELSLSKMAEQATGDIPTEAMKQQWINMLEKIRAKVRSGYVLNERELQLLQVILDACMGHVASEAEFFDLILSMIEEIILLNGENELETQLGGRSTDE